MSEAVFESNKKLPYLVGVGGDIYDKDIQSLAMVEMSEDTGDTATIYFDQRQIDGPDADIEIKGETDRLLLNSIVSDEHMKHSLLRNNTQTLKGIVNRKTNLENNRVYNHAMKRMLEEEIYITEKDITHVKESIHNKNRLIEIQKFYTDKSKHQLDILKTCVTISLIMFGITFVYKIGIISDSAFVIFIGLGLTVLVLYAISQVFDIFMRDNTRYDEYRFINSRYYLNKNKDIANELKSNIPAYEEENIISNKCYNIMKNNSP